MDDSDQNEIECPICGKRVSSEARSCPKCGLRFYPDEPSETADSENVSDGKDRWALIGDARAEGKYSGEMMMAYPKHRKWFGVLFVTAIGLAYGIFSQTINHLFMPGIPLYQPPFGALGNIILAGLVGASLGYLIASSESGGVGVLWGSLLGGAFIAIATLLTGRAEGEILWRKIAAVAIIFAPTAALLAPVLILFRWVIGREVESYRNASKGYSYARFQRYALPTVLVLAAGALGLSSMYNDLGRAVTPSMQSLIQQGRQAAGVEMLPEPLRPPDVKYFIKQKDTRYTLQWDKDDQNRFAIPRPAGSGFDQSTVIARFDNGYLLACMFPGKTGQPTCKDFLPEKNPLSR